MQIQVDTSRSSSASPRLEFTGRSAPGRLPQHDGADVDDQLADDNAAPGPAISASCPTGRTGLAQPTVRLPRPQATVQASVPPAISSLPIQRALTGKDFENIEVVCYFGEALGLLHKNHQSTAHSQEPLRVVQDAESRIASVEGTPAKAALCKVDIASAKVLVAALKRDLQAAAQLRVYGDFNLYPGALRIEADGSFTNSPDHKQTGWHADFEPLNRLAYTARLDHVRLESMLDAYYGARDQQSVSQTQREAAFKAKTLFDVLYYFYFIDTAFGMPSQRAAGHQAAPESLRQAWLMQSRLIEDQQVNVGANLPSLGFVDV